MSADPAAGPGPDPAAAPHADPDRLADLAEGLLSAADTAAVQGHLASCPDCAADFALITESFDLAAFLPAEPIPAEVAARVQAAIEREPVLVAAPGPTGRPAAPTAVPVRPRRHRFRLALTSLAAASALGVAVLGISSAVHNSVVENKSSSSGAAAAAPSNDGALAAIVIGDAQSAQQTAARLLHAHPFAATPDDGGSTGGSAPNPQAAAGLPACVSGVATGQTLLASTAVSYQGQPAWLLVYRQTADPKQADVLVVSQSCGGVTPDAAAGSTGAEPTRTANVPAPLLRTTVAIP